MSATRRSVCLDSSSQMSGDEDSLVGCSDVDTSLVFDSPLESSSPKLMDRCASGAQENDNGSGDEALAKPLKSPPTSVSSFTRDLLELRQKRQQCRRLRNQLKGQQSQMTAEVNAFVRRQPLSRFIFSDMQHWLSTGAEETALPDLVNRGNRDTLLQDVGLKPDTGRKVSLSTIRKSQIAEYLRGLKCNGGDGNSTTSV